MGAFEMQGVYVRRGGFLLQDISFSLEEGQTAAVLGRSGSGKTTLLMSAGNALVADAGIIRYFGKELCEDEEGIRGAMSVIYGQPYFNTEYRAVRLAEEVARFEPGFSMEFFEEGMEWFGLDGQRRLKHLSKGAMKQYMLVLALSRRPALLVMDEPTSGLDGESRSRFWQLIADYREGRSLTVLFSTHHEDDLYWECESEQEPGTNWKSADEGRGLGWGAVRTGTSKVLRLVLDNGRLVP